jgi:hypothetical protein
MSCSYTKGEPDKTPVPAYEEQRFRRRVWILLAQPSGKLKSWTASGLSAARKVKQSSTHSKQRPCSPFATAPRGSLFCFSSQILQMFTGNCEPHTSETWFRAGIQLA